MVDHSRTKSRAATLFRLQQKGRIACTGGAVVRSFGVAEHDDRGYNALHEAFDWLTQRIADSS